jgi:lipopolysaccharide transport system permease protein
VAQPLALLAIFGTVMSRFLHVQSDGLPYASFAFAGLVPWAFFSAAVTAGVPSILNASGIVGKVYFPRELIPLSATVASGIDLAIATGLLVALAMGQGVGLSITAVALVPVDLVLVLWVAAITVLGATLTVFVRDLRHVVPIALQLAFFATPIVYPATLVPEGFRWIERANPVAVVAQSTRDVVLHHQWPPWAWLAVHAVVGLVLLVVAVAYARSVEPRIPDVL